MKLYYYALIALAVLLALWMTTAAHAASAQDMQQESAYLFTFKTLIGQKPLPLAQYHGRVVLVVNTASQCGFTSQYEKLEQLYQRFKDKGLIVLGVPSNDFGAQEPGTNDQIASFCKLNYGVSFPMAAKEQVSGSGAHPFFRWARDTLGFTAAPKWNFHKYLIDRKGRLVDYFNSTTAPDNERLIAAVEQLLAETD